MWKEIYEELKGFALAVVLMISLWPPLHWLWGDQVGPVMRGNVWMIYNKNAYITYMIWSDPCCGKGIQFYHEEIKKEPWGGTHSTLTWRLRFEVPKEHRR